MNNKHLLIIGGPTASGKTSLAIEVAKHFQTEIISADSRQVYQEMDIVVSRPSPVELAEVPHHFIASHSIHTPLSAGQYEIEAINLLDKLYQKHDYVVMCGGSGLFIKAVTNGFDPLPSDKDLLLSIEEKFQQNGLAWLQNEIAIKDPTYFAEVDKQNARRLMRALEVITLSGQSFSSQRKNKAKERTFKSQYFGLDWPREKLYQRIDQRVQEMVNAGMQQEARKLRPFRNLQALQTVGYNEWFEHFDGKMSEAETIVKIQQHTRQYAKRQLTWCRKEMEMNWLPTSKSEDHLSSIQEKLGM